MTQLIQQEGTNGSADYRNTQPDIQCSPDTPRAVSRVLAPAAAAAAAAAAATAHCPYTHKVLDQSGLESNQLQQQLLQMYTKAPSLPSDPTIVKIRKADNRKAIN